METLKMDHQILHLATLLKSTIRSESNIFSISTEILQYMNKLFDANIEECDALTASFNTRLGASPKSEFLNNLQFLYNFVQQTKSLKLYADIECNDIDISKFINIKLLDLNKVNVNRIRGIQKLRSYLQKLVCKRSVASLSDILLKCDDDNSLDNCWNELKDVSFTNNNLLELDKSLECIPWVNVLDLSHNQLKNVDALSCLTNLKNLNLAFNQLEAIPHFQGPICGQLLVNVKLSENNFNSIIPFQNLILKNNFIEDISGLQSLGNVSVLDLSNNCLIDHKSLICLSHLATLQYLNLTSNPLSFHPHHRTLTASYLHINIISSPFVLDETILDKSQRKVVGSLHPMQLMKISSSFANEPPNVSTDKIRRIRHVTIEDETITTKQTVPLLAPSPSSRQHLETKKQIEDLREQFGESWLNTSSGLAVQNMLGLAMNTNLSRIDDSFHQSDCPINKSLNDNENPEDQHLDDQSDASFLTAFDTTLVNENQSDDDGDIDLGGEENMYLATPFGETESIFLVITNLHISEKECSTSKERIRWHVNSIINCKPLEDLGKVQLDFDTMRKDRKQRIYEMEEEEMDKFLVCIKERMAQIPKTTKMNYQCMKCSAQFSKNDDRVVISKMICPKCESTLVVEDL